MRFCKIVVLYALFSFSFGDEDLYSILGINRRASNSEIRRAYRQLAKEWHPDKNKDPEAGDKFTKINEAYETLMDSDKRAEYDKFGRTAANQGQAQQRGFRGFSGFPGGFDPFESFFSNGPFRGFNFNFGGEDVESNVDKYRITVREYEMNILPHSNEKPYLLYAYRDFCRQCMFVEKHWDNIVHDLEYIGMGVGAVNVQIDRRLTSRLRVSSIPSIMAVINGRVKWMDLSSRFEMKAFKGFLRSLFDPSLIPQVTDGNIDSFLSGWKENRVQAVFSFNRPEPSLRYLVAAFTYKHFYNVGFINNADDSAPEVMATFDIDSYQESLLIFKEDTTTPHQMYSKKNLEADFIAQVMEANKLLTTPRLSSQFMFDSLCPANNRKRKQVCVVLLRRSLAFDQQIADNFNQFASERSTPDIKYVYVLEETQPGFVAAVTRGSNVFNETFNSLKVVILWRKDVHQVKVDYVEDGWTADTKKRTKTKLTTDLEHLVQGLGSLPYIIDLHHDLEDEFKPSLSDRIVSRLSTWLFVAQEKILDTWYNSDEVTVLMVVMTVTMMLVIGLLMRTTVMAESESRHNTYNEYTANRKKSSPPTKQTANNDSSDATVYLHPLCPESFGRLVTDLQPGMRTVIILVDTESRDKLLKEFVSVMYPYTRAHAFNFSILQLEHYLNWYRTLLETTLDFRRDLTNINKRNCIGTVIAINGYRRYYHIFHAQRERRAVEGEFMGFESSDSENEDDGANKLFHSDLLKGLPDWMESLIEGQQKRFRVDYWPGMETL